MPGPEDLFAGFPDSLAVFRAVADAVADIGEVSTTTSRSQVSFRRRRGFAYVRMRTAPERTDIDIPHLLSSALRPGDLVSLYAPGDHGILLIESSSDEVTAHVARMKQVLADAGHQVTTGVAEFPRDGRSPEALTA